jgi:hypothetical protein
MPTYTFQCPRCLRTQEHMMAMSQADGFITTCSGTAALRGRKHPPTRMLRIIDSPPAGHVRNPAAPRKERRR